MDEHALARVAQGVLDQVHQHPLQLMRIDLDSRGLIQREIQPAAALTNAVHRLQHNVLDGPRGTDRGDRPGLQAR